jgi:hypothetical protein
MEFLLQLNQNHKSWIVRSVKGTNSQIYSAQTMALRQTALDNIPNLTEFGNTVMVVLEVLETHLERILQLTFFRPQEGRQQVVR